MVTQKVGHGVEVEPFDHVELELTIDKQTCHLKQYKSDDFGQTSNVGEHI